LLLPAAAGAQRVAVLPIQPVVEAKDKDAAFIEEKFHRELRAQGATLIVGDEIRRAMAIAGIRTTRSCGLRCLVRIGRVVKAQRVLAPTLSLQKKVQSVGTVWIWSTRQVHVEKAINWGVFTRMCMCRKDTWNKVARRQVTRMLNYDPAQRLTLKKHELPLRAQEGPPQVPGMVVVPQGAFIMGSDRGEFDEEPRHRVELDEYYIDRFEVTNQAYNQCVAARKCRRQRYWYDKSINQPKQPVVGVGWDDANNYCAFAGKRLPTEAEWEKAARGTDERIYPWGNIFKVTWVNMHHGKDGFKSTAPVGSFKHNKSPYGAMDMAGNAWEWTQDYWNSRYYNNSPIKNPKGPKKGVKRVMRGGSWLYDVPFFVTAFNRSPGRPWIRKKYVGFRCAKTR
jgi:iron(II)-dependent oxidoreductase